jgi:hypothetical protein
VGQGRFITVGEKKIWDLEGWPSWRVLTISSIIKHLRRRQLSLPRAAGGIADLSALICLCAGAQQWQDHGVDRIIGEICEFDVAVQAPMLDLLRGLSRRQFG